MSTPDAGGRTGLKTVSIIATGGTIASGTGEKGLKPTYQLGEMLSELPGLDELAVIRPHQLMNKDSSDMTPEDWVRIAVQAYKELQLADAVVITHGTDTMAYTSSMLSFMLRNLDKPVILTGSQRPWAEPRSDAKTNLLDAVRVAVQAADHRLRGVYIVFHGKIIKGCRVKKSKYLEHSELDAFDTINYPLIGLVKDTHLAVNPLLAMSPQAEGGEPALDTRIDKRILMLTLTPGFDPTLLDSLRDRYQAIIIQAYGLGNMPITGKAAMVPHMKAWLDEGKIVAVTSQACYETDLNQYETGRRFLELGIIPTLDMTQEAAYTKMMWALGQANERGQVHDLMWTNMAGEIWPLNGNGRTLDIMGEMARYHDLTRRLYESNTQLMEVMGTIFSKIKASR
ncbi:MAG: asparaginase [Candidatus Aenigmarchaeota archaeon]|nr:asparaginase [Candidatus Aenigmarchaeota archaeon]